VTTSPTGRTQASTIDTLGKPTQVQLASLDAVNATYDDRGRLASVSSGSGAAARTSTFTYNAEGFLATLTDPIERITRLDYDAAGRVTSKTLADGRVVLFGFDAAGNSTSLTPPSRRHTSYSDRNELIAVTRRPAGAGPTTFAYDSDRALTTVSRPDGQIITIGYDAAGRRDRTIAGRRHQRDRHVQL
jgi:YD repeat-containing protein